jgi:3',5'-cyclic AMP phosphodiesterase CpdA
MSAFPQLRILHLSDLHFHTPISNGRSNHICSPDDATASRAGFPTLLKLIQADLSSDYWKKITWATQSGELEHTRFIIAATGDFVHTAKPTEYDQAFNFLGGLIQEPILGTKMKIEDVFVVPGNHDVVFDQHEPAHRFAPYCNFYNKLFKSIQPDVRDFARPEDSSALSQIHMFRDDRFLIAEINSSYYVEQETVDESRGQVDMAVIGSLRRELEDAAAETKDWIKIALVHHHPILLPSFVEAGRGVDAIMNARSLVGLLRQHGFQLILHGHKHFPQVFSYDPDPAWTSAETSASQLIVAGGSAGSISLPAGKRRANTYNLMTIKWIPQALQARVQIVTRGLIRSDDASDLDPDQWKWETLRIYDKVLSPYANFPLPKNFNRVRFPQGGDKLEESRDSEYKNLRFNMPVIEVFPSLLPGQGYEARVWLERHRHHKESPTKVVWSAGPMFDRKIIDAGAAPDFCVSFHYWGPMLIQAELTFADDAKSIAHIYARLPDAITRL